MNFEDDISRIYELEAVLLNLGFRSGRASAIEKKSDTFYHVFARECIEGWVNFYFIATQEDGISIIACSWKEREQKSYTKLEDVLMSLSEKERVSLIFFADLFQKYFI